MTISDIFIFILSDYMKGVGIEVKCWLIFYLYLVVQMVIKFSLKIYEKYLKNQSVILKCISLLIYQNTSLRMFISTWRGFVEKDKNRNKVYYDGKTVLFNFGILKILFFNVYFLLRYFDIFYHKLYN